MSARTAKPSAGSPPARASWRSPAPSAERRSSVKADPFSRTKGIHPPPGARAAQKRLQHPQDAARQTAPSPNCEPNRRRRLRRLRPPRTVIDGCAVTDRSGNAAVRHCLAGELWVAVGNEEIPTTVQFSPKAEPERWWEFLSCLSLTKKMQARSCFTTTVVENFTMCRNGENVLDYSKKLSQTLLPIHNYIFHVSS